jgi:predicted kinase
MDTAKFVNIDGKAALLCSKCEKVIKTEEQFNTVERFAYEGTTKMLPVYCDEHQYMGMYGIKRKRELLRKGIKEKLRERLMEKNVLGVEITRPNQVMIIMRGIPGAGKSTKAKSLVGEGIIHSTDDVIEEATGDYNGFFKRINDSGDWSEHGKMHHKNYLNAKASLEQGISPVIVDNTNIKASEPKKYVEAALRLGLSEDNIKIVDVGDGGQKAEILAKRNTHNVPLRVINRMLSSHRGVGKLTVKKILEAKGGVKNEDKVLYSAVVLDKESQSKLLEQFPAPEGWRKIAHHMTIVFGKGLEDKSEVGKEVELTVTELGISDMAMAVKVEGYPSVNKIPHITIAVNDKEGGKPVMSNNITNWDKVDLGFNLRLHGIVTEIKA